MTIGFTVGIWDLFHKGHIEFLKKCKLKCDYLIVGIMNDYWVKVQKGNERPKELLQIRFNKLQLSGLCDKIIILNTLNMSAYLQICDIWFKGEDQNKMKPEYFKNIIVIPRYKGISTTEIIKRKK